MKASRTFLSLVLLALLVPVLAACDGEGSAEASGAAAPAVGATSPVFQVDPGWPEQLPNDWIMSVVTAVFVDSRDHVWVANLPELLTPEEIGAVQDPPLAECCAPPPVVLEFDPEGRLVQGWGVPSQDISEWPRNPHGLFVDHNDYVWVGTHSHDRVMKFTREGDLVMTIGEYNETGGSHDERLLGGPAGIWVDPGTNEVFIADGYKNRRVIVVDGETGEYIRHWGAYGEAPDDDYDYGDRDPAGPLPRQFSNVHGLIGSNDGLIYVADRRGNRIQVFDQAGAFVTERIIAPETRSSGSAFVLALSADPDQEFLYMADGTNHKIWILRRGDMEVVGEFGHPGRQAGQFLRPHGISVDSRGNIYVGEASTGRRIQKFTIQGQAGAGR
jgi:streptogramin lyase